MSRLTVISLGAGVQSTTVALMAAHGEITPMPDCAIFADTGWEPQPVYDHLAWLSSGNVLPFPVRKVSAGDIRADTVSKNSPRSGRFASIPWFLRQTKPSGAYQDGRGKRQCTAHYKIEPIAMALRTLLGVGPRGYIARDTVEIWIGISRDEAHRMKPPRQRYQKGRWPLLELNMTRQDCLRWLERHGYPRPPKSSCIGCPYHSNAMWREMRDQRPAEFGDAVALDRLIRDGGTARGIRGQQFMHRQMVPLDEADLADPPAEPDLFGEECEGMCGV